jgi:hypothetical protein
LQEIGFPSSEQIEWDQIASIAYPAWGRPPAPSGNEGVLMRFRKDESGQMIVMLAVSMTALMAFMALAVDVGILFHVRREVQIAADAAAMAGALDYHYNPTGSTARAAATAAASQNGVSSGSVNVTFPTSSFYGSPYSTGFVQAIVSVPNPTMFMRLFGMTNVNLVSSAVAGPGASQGCVWSLGGAGTDIGGSGGLTATGCEIYDNSSSGTALDLTGGGSISAKQVGVTGGFSGTVRPTPITRMVPVSNPLASLAAPGIPGGPCNLPQSWSSGGHSLTAGCYSSISISGTASLTLSAGNYTIQGNFSDSSSGGLTLGSGRYLVGKGLQLTGTGSVTGTGVSFFTGLTPPFTPSDATVLSRSGTVDLTAPNSGTDNGVLIFQSGSDTQAMTITEPGNSMTLEGIVYAPNAALDFGGAGSSNVYADFVVGSLNITGSPRMQNYASVNTGTPLTKIVMVQ